MNNELQFDCPLPWQTAQWQNLVKRRQNHNLPHALLLHGISGLGKNLFAHAFAKFLLCKTPTAENKACNNCRSCHLIQAGNYSELYLLQPENQSKVIRIDQVRELTEQLIQTPQLGQNKVAILAPAEAMPAGAANALLKTLEEPAANSFLLLVTSQPGLIPATIRSRCQQVAFTVPPKALALTWLNKQFGNSDSEHESLLALAQGAPLQAQVLAESQNIRRELLNALKLLMNNKADPVKVSAAMLKQPLNILLDCLLSMLMDIIRLKQGFPLDSITDKQNINIFSEAATALRVFDLFSYYDKLFKLRINLNSVGSLNQQLLLEDLFCTWYSYGKNITC